MKKLPMRTCVVSKEKCEKRDLLRIVRTPEKEVIIDETGKANGRGAYLKKDIDEKNKARATKILDNVVEVNIPDSLYDEMLEKIN